MRVMCIKGVKEGYVSLIGIPVCSDEELYEGKVYTVTSIEIMAGRDFYQLSERPKNCLYVSSRFIPLSDIDEIEMVIEKPEILQL